MLLPAMNVNRPTSISTLTLLILALYSSALPAAVRRVADIVVAPNGATFSGTLRVTPCAADVCTCPFNKYFTIPIVNGYLDVDLSPEPKTILFRAQYVSNDQRVQWEEEWSLPAKGMPWQVAELRARSQHRNRCGAEDDPVNQATGSMLGPREVRDPPAETSYNANRSYFAVGHILPGIVTGPPSGDLTLPAPPSLSAADHDVPPKTQQATARGVTRAVASTLTEADVLGLVQDLQIRPVLGPGFTNSRAAIISDTGGIEGAVGALTDCVRVDGSAAPCSATFAAPFVDAEVPSGTINGINPSFIISAAPSPATSLQVFRNGLLNRSGHDYTVNGNTITFESGALPQAGDALTTYYRK